MVMALCPRHGWSTYACRDASPSSPRCATSPSSPEYTPAMPLYSSTLAMLPKSLLRGMHYLWSLTKVVTMATAIVR